MNVSDMKKTNLMLLLLSALALLGGCSKDDAPKAADAHGDGEESGEHAEGERGPHGGRLFKDGDVTVELSIFEQGVPPEFRGWVTQGGKPVAPSQAQLNVELKRFGNVMERIAFSPEQDFLRSTTEVREPHSFEVRIEATVAGTAHGWKYESLEGRVEIVAAAAKDAGVAIETAGPRMIADVLPLYGVIAANPEAVRAVSARYPGPIRSVTKSLGDVVARGEVLATVESNESLQTYSVVAPIGGVITNRHANPGEVADDDALFEVTDLSNVTAQLSVFARDMARVRPGQRVHVRSVDNAIEGQGQVVRASPGGTGTNQALIVQVKLDNRERRWTPGLYVNADVLVGGEEVAVAVKTDALQRFRDWQVVFRNQGDLYEAQPVEVGRTDGEWVEVVSGLPAGAPYVAANSFLIKAHIEKSSAAHDH